MPLHHQICKSDACGWMAELFVNAGENPPCPKCGEDTERLWIGSAAAVQDDTIIGGMTIENLAPDPITFYSKSEYKRYLKEHGFINKVRHVGTQDGDRSPHTTRWI